MSGGKIYKFIDTLQKRLQQWNFQNSKKGIIFGYTSALQNNCCYCMGCTENLNDIPFGNNLIGAYFLESFDEDSIVVFCNELSKNKTSGKLLVYNYNENIEKISLFDIKSKKLIDYTIEIVDHQVALEPLIQIKLDVNFKLNISFEDSIPTTNISSIIEQLNSWIFRLDMSSFKINGKEENLNGICIEDLYNQIEQFEELQDLQIPTNMKKKMIEKSQRQLRSRKSILQFKLDNNIEKSDSPEKFEENQKYDFIFNLKMFYLLQLQNNLQQLYKIFINSLTKMLTLMQKYFDDNPEKKCPLQIPRVVNFYEPNIYTHIITILYHDLDSIEIYKDQRKSLHLKYLVPMSRPTFKLANAIGRDFSGKKLMNVHVGLQSSIKNGQCYIVKGKYSYHHYNQDHMDDSGWGCAYRSLQTIISWFQIQGYIDIETVPTHKEIQQALIDVGDKPPNFLGSSKWIGSQEVCYVLSHLYDIQSKIIFINSATELLDKARDLIKHFSTNGTPIMIGGGVLAHTIIGVDFNEATGDVKYLVLDPHYIGDENLNNIHKKGGCAWKPVTFWDKNSFYNLCLPQVSEDF
ncbi:ufm1-specific protease 2-like protein [Dermatophagoides farinae]|uniref:Probable Ufm1-specific protease 2 n=1 Tax=Dermatophagoides farinae TaxID=6954 RepID=A0A9D4P7W7_DERFA|nr:ufm1-specific protease 2-like [Dermatophagoides farinae]KAH7646425.1 ufm1-specific protease 2-like protein [Dermatophagoides farinae]